MSFELKLQDTSSPRQAQVQIPTIQEPQDGSPSEVLEAAPSQTLKKKGAQTSELYVDETAFRRSSISTLSDISTDGTVPMQTRPQQRSSSRTPMSFPGWRGTLSSFWQRNGGLLLVIGSQFFGSMMNTIARYLEHTDHSLRPFQLLLIRMFMTSAFCWTYMWRMKVPNFPFGAKGIRLILAFRAIIGFFGITGMYYSLLYLPVAEATVLTFIAPAVAGVVCYFLMGEPFTRREQIATVLSLIGVVLIARPVSFFQVSVADSAEAPNFNSTTSANSTAPQVEANPFQEATASERLTAVGYAMVGVIGSAGAFVCLRRIGKSAHPLISVNYFSTYCTVISFCVLTVATFISPSIASSTGDFTTFYPTSWKQMALIVLIGIAGLTMLTMLTAGLAFESSNRATNMVYTSMLFALFFDRVIFNQSPGVWSLLGSGLILGSALFVAVSKSQGDAVPKSSGDTQRRRADYERVPDEEQGMLENVDGLNQTDDADEVALQELDS